MNNAARTESFQEIIRGDKPVLVDFYADWCGPCKMQAPTLKQLADRMGDKLRILKIDIDRSRAAAQQYQIQSVPTLILFKEGKIIWRQSGVQPLHRLEAMVKPHAG
ncbi:thioredoxin [Fibrisoma montanum]|uniref:Thioredoxin n=1 Tax=Fibrisoma montanum TaxID=2305895 RepID=A0A418MI39_9BACT|nr:thioredoxin [Fibrisoma montanum]RIV27090.1 thioredoxin [Fibrisoma montanum]